MFPHDEMETVYYLEWYHMDAPFFLSNQVVHYDLNDSGVNCG